MLQLHCFGKSYGMPSERILVLGASRGLGAELVRGLCGLGPSMSVLGVARKEPLLHQLTTECNGQFKAKGLDLSHPDSWPILDKILSEFSPTRIFYVAGGGPFGAFGEKSFSAHQWAWRVTFETPAFLAHRLLQSHDHTPLILVGSSVCENRADAKASSYSAAKHALLGLYKSLREEEPRWDLRLYSPGYMDTSLIPPNAKVRSKTLWDPKVVAGDLLTWAFDPMCVGEHKVLSLFPTD